VGVEISSGKSPGFQVESLRKLAAIFASFRVLSCRMLPLEDRINQKAFRVALVSTRPLQVAEDAAAICRSTCTTKPTASPIAASVFAEAGVGVVAHDQIGETAESFLCRVGMNCDHRTRMARVEGIEQRARLDSVHFTFWRKTNLTSVTKSNEFSAGSYSWEE